MYASVTTLRLGQFYDDQTNQYVSLSEGWDRQHHLHGCLIHIEIVNGTVWVQVDETKDGIAEALIQAGIPKTEIVLGFHELEIRPYTGFAIA